MEINTADYGLFFEEIKQQIRKSQYEALKKVNIELINLYWGIGKLIVERQESFGWGKSVVVKLSEDLQNEFSGIRGFSSFTLWRMRKFYLNYMGNEKLAPMVQEIGWSHNIVILEKCKDDQEREF